MANGIPIMVIASKSPIITWLSAIQIPPKINQMIFIKTFRQPFELGLLSIFLPKGQSATNASLNTCKPKGIPIMVMQSTSPPTKYSMKINIPPNSNQIILPRIFIKQKYKNKLESLYPEIYCIKLALEKGILFYLWDGNLNVGEIKSIKMN